MEGKESQTVGYWSPPPSLSAFDIPCLPARFARRASKKPAAVTPQVFIPRFARQESRTHRGVKKEPSKQNLHGFEQTSTARKKSLPGVRQFPPRL